jgi:SAM-dependent methyltransferase
MHQRVLDAWLEIFDRFPPPGPVTIELGASETPQESLLAPLHRRNPEGRYIGVNLKYSAEAQGRGGPYELLESNANDLAAIDDESIDAVVTNAMLEHDEAFWLSLAEVRRVLRPGGLFYVGVPGYSSDPTTAQRSLRVASRSRVGRQPLVRDGLRRLRHEVFGGTPTMVFHAAPDDFWRFSEQAVRRIFLKDMECLTFVSVMRPPRFLAVGRKPPAVAR